MTPREYYQRQIKSHSIQTNPEQDEIVSLLDKLYTELLQSQKKSWFHSLLHPSTSTAPKGLYLWGQVGVGKTFLIDILYACLPIKKLRLHFHSFMQRIQDELRKQQGHQDPLHAIAKELSEEARLIFLDEFLVTNIVDAMILSELLRSLFEHGICLVTTSNLPPDDLYLNGIQREQFLPAIALIKNNTTVLEIKNTKDYRLQYITHAGVYFTPWGEPAENQLENIFEQLSHYEIAYEEPSTDSFITLFNRSILIKKKTKDIIWFDFVDICDPPRSQKDFLAITEKYKTVLISNVPIIRAFENNRAASFINLIDVFYDAKTHLILSAEAEIPQLYPEGPLRFAFARTESRLMEMQSAHYLEHTRACS